MGGSPRTVRQSRATTRALVAVLLVVILGAVVAWQAGLVGPAGRPPPAPVAPPRSGFEAPWATEQEWLVDLIVRDIAEMVALAKTRALPEPQALTVKVSQRGDGEPLRPPVDVSVSFAAGSGLEPTVVSETLRFTEHLFAPSQYADIARRLLGKGPDPKRQGGPAPPARSERLLAALLDLRAPVLLEQDHALSARLEEDLLDAEAHGEAALLLGAFSLRDAAGCFTDTRPALCRMTAHLAVREALSDEPGLSGRYAEALLLTLAGRETEALAKLDGLAATSGPSRVQRAWIRALRQRNTGDWRTTVDQGSLTLLETLEEFRATASRLDDGLAVRRLDTRHPPSVSDWSRLAMQARPSVETGHRFSSAGLALENAETADAWMAYGSKAPLDESTLVDALNAPPGRLIAKDATGRARVQVLGWGVWAFSGQRHLLQQVLRHEWFLRYQLGLKDDAADFSQHAQEALGRLALYPIVLRAGALDAVAYSNAVGDAGALARRSPERMTGGHWALLREKPAFAAPPPSLPNEDAWFRPSLPSGTLFDLDGRLTRLGDLVRPAPGYVRSLREQAPHDFALAEFATRLAVPPLRASAQLIQAFGSLVEYDTFAMNLVADRAWYDPPEFKKLQGRLCELIPPRCFLLGHRLAELGLPEEAARAFQRGFDRSEDRVGAANQCRWLVDYYFDRGETGKALSVAKEAAATHAAAGLFVMARLMERMGRLADAEEYYRTILKRYEDPKELAGFYYRQARVSGHRSYENKLATVLTRALPKGLETLDRARLPAPPTDGVVIRGENDNTLRYLIKWGHVIVGLDGFRVHDFEQYDAIRALSQSPQMTLLIWRGNRYEEVKTELWNRRFLIDMRTYEPKAGESSPAPAASGGVAKRP